LQRILPPQLCPKSTLIIRECDFWLGKNFALENPKNPKID
jgi:hypothetical protein